MANSSIFKARPEHYEKNRARASSIRVAPAIIRTPNGSQQPGVGIFTDHMIRFIFSIDEALSIANAIADSVELSEQATTPHTNKATESETAA